MSLKTRMDLVILHGSSDILHGSTHYMCLLVLYESSDVTYILWYYNDLSTLPYSTDFTFVCWCHLGLVTLHWFSDITFTSFFFTFYNCIVPMDFSHGKFGLLFPGESQLRQSRATQPTVHTGCLIIHNPLNSDMDYGIFNVRTDVNACDCARGCTDTVREPVLKVDSRRKITCRTGESNLRRRRAGPMLY